jgi:hypothetical protein
MLAAVAAASMGIAMRPISAAPIYSNVFDVGLSEWSVPTVSTRNGESFLASSPNGFSNQTATLTLTDLPIHGTVTVGFDLYVIQSMDGNGPEGGGPDNWQLTADGTNLLFTNFANWTNGNTQAYPNQLPPFGPGGAFAPRTGAFENGHLGLGLGGFGDSTYRFSFTFPHSASTLVLAFRGLQNEAVDNEGWGLDNVTVDVGIPEPATWWLAALAVVFLPRRRKRSWPRATSIGGG